MHCLYSLVEEYIVDVWEIQKSQLYNSYSRESHQLYSQSFLGDLTVNEG